MYIPNSGTLQLADSARSPTTLDYLRPAFFRLELSNLPRTTFTCQVANIPELKIGYAVQPTPALDIPVIGDKVEFGPLNVEFIINEDMSNYIEVYNWILSIASRELVNYTVDDFRRAAVNYPLTLNKGSLDNSLYADASLYLINSSNVPSVKINYYDVIPISLESIPFDITSNNQNPMRATATFRYRLFNIEKLI